jgi:hypothetical protein
VRETPNTAETDKDGKRMGEEEEEEEDYYDGIINDDGENAWRSPEAKKSASKSSNDEENKTGSSGGGDGTDDSIQLASVEAFSAAAPVMNGFKAVPLDGGFVIDVREIPVELLMNVSLPPQNTYVRTAFDLNLDGLDKKPWRSASNTTTSNNGVRSALMDAHFNFGLDEKTWVMYARRQRYLFYHKSFFFSSK